MKGFFMKKEIQVISYKRNHMLKNEKIHNTELNNPQSLNQFDINIIYLGDRDLWYSKGQATKLNKINAEKDLKHLSRMIEEAVDSNIVVILPQSINVHYNYRREDAKDATITELKNMLSDFKEIIQGLLPPYDIPLIFENNDTNIKNANITSAFYFDTTLEEKIVTLSEYGERVTTVQSDQGDNKGIYVTTLNLNNKDSIYNFLIYLGLIEGKEIQAPEWIDNYPILNDMSLRKHVEENKENVRLLKLELEEYSKEIKENNEYKEVLYENGVELERRIFQILGEILRKDLSNIIDLKKEDFLIDLDDVTYIGEIKGVNSNVRNSHISQLVTHVDEYIEELEDQGEVVNIDKIKPLLIINHQRNKEIKNRKIIHENQIHKAERDDVLIIETRTLLKIFEQYIQKELKTEEIIDLFNTTTGLLSDISIDS